MTRHNARRNRLQSADFAAALDTIRRNMLGLEWAVIGGVAVAFHANPPVTVDIDVLLYGDRSIEDDLRGRMTDWGMKRLWFPSSSMRGLPQHGWQFRHETGFQAECDILLTGMDGYLRQVVQRAKPQASGVCVATPEDIVVMKSMIGRDKDWEDIQELTRMLNRMM